MAKDEVDTMKKVLKNSCISAIIICSVIIFYQIFNIINAKSISDIIDSGDTGETIENKIPIYVEDIVKGLGTSIDYAVFANEFTQQTHMEGNIAVKDAYISQIFNFTSSVIKVNKSNTYSITIKNKENATQIDGTFKFGLFTKEVNSQTGEEQFIRTNHESITVTTENGEGTANFRKLDPDTKYYIFQLDENGNPIMNNTTTSDGTTVKYGDEEVVISESNLKNANTSYIENIKQWTNHAADANDGENPKLVIPMKEYLNLSVDANGHLSHSNSGIILSTDSKDFELIVIGEDGKNYTVVRNQENGTYELKERADDYKTINFGSEFLKLNIFSSILYNVAESSDEVNVINLDADGSIYKDEQVNGLNRGNADSETLDLSKYLEDDKYLVINVDMSGLENIDLTNTINWGDLGGNFSWNTVSTRILWNFYNEDENIPYTGDINIQKNNIIGTILAPSANVIVGTTINASIISDKASNPGGEIHKSQFNQSRAKRRISCFNFKNNTEAGNISINLNKIDSATTEPLENSIFKIMIKDGDTIILDKTESTDTNGKININGIQLPKEEKTYTVAVEEVSPPEGYNSNKNVEFDINIVLKEGKYELQPVDTYTKDGVEVTIHTDLINITVPNDKIKEIKGTFNIKLTKKDSNNNSLLNDIIFDIKVLDDNSNPVDFINDSTGEKINLEGLTTGKQNEDGVISIENIKIEGIEKYTVILTERQNDLYKPIEPITINIQTVSDNEEYKLGEVTLDNSSRDDVILQKENNNILLDVKNTKEIAGTYNVEFQKINSITKAGLNGVKFHITIYDDENNIIIDENMSTQNIEGKAGYININDIAVAKPGIHKCEIKEIESLDGYKKFEQTIIAEIEFGMNDSEDGYEIKSVKNKGVFSENLKIDKEENSNNVEIVLANDPLDDKDENHISEIEKRPGILPQTGELNILIKIVVTIIIINIIVVIGYLIYKKR